MPIEAVVEGVADEVADNLEEIAAATRRINPNSVGGFVIGLAVGVGIGFYFGHRWNREKIRAEAFQQSEEEVEKIREIYQQKAVAAVPKPTVEEVMEERGYSMGVDTPQRPLAPPVPVREPVSAPPVPMPEEDDWDYSTELENRVAGEPYVIHQNERGEVEGYSSVTYTYYAGDDVLVDEADERVVLNPDLAVGVHNLKFGHGSDDENVVFVRNDKLEMEMEICRSPRSYEEDVLGLERHDTEPS